MAFNKARFTHSFPVKPPAGSLTSCYCSNNRFGPSCRHSIDRQAEHYPPALTTNRPCSRDAAATRAFQRTLDRSQSCRAGSRLRVYSMPKYGLGSVFSYAVYAFASAASSGAVFEEPVKSLPGFAPPTCQNGGFACYLENFSGCNAGVRTGRLGKRSINFLVSRQRKDWRNLLFGPSARTRGTFWFHSQLVHRLWRLRKSEKDAANAVQRNFTWSPASSCVAVHVRHGDACKDHRSQRKCYPAAMYLRHVRRLKARYNLKGVFLATDDPSVVRAFMAASDLKVSTQSVDRNWLSGGGGTRIETRMKSSGARGGQVQGRIGRETVVDMELLARCSAFVGTFSTNLGRLAFEIMAARSSSLPPYVSLDIGWCPGFAKDNGYVWSSRGRKIKFDC